MTAHDMLLSRRTALKGMAGLIIGVSLPDITFAQSGAARAFGAGAAAGAPTPLAPNAFVRVGLDDTVTVLIKHIEMGQGPFTGLATLVADEMDADQEVKLSWLHTEKKNHRVVLPSCFSEWRSSPGSCFFFKFGM